MMVLTSAPVVAWRLSVRGQRGSARVYGSLPSEPARTPAGPGDAFCALHDLYHRQEITAAVLVRGIEGFGIKHQLHTERLLTLSEDLPLVSVAVDRRSRIEALLPAVSELVTGGLVTLERARMLTTPVGSIQLPQELQGATKLTIYLGRKELTGKQSAYRQIVALLAARGLAGATVLLGVDGMLHGERRRAGFFSTNSGVPLMIVSLGAGEPWGARPGCQTHPGQPFDGPTREVVAEKAATRVAAAARLT